MVVFSPTMQSEVYISILHDFHALVKTADVFFKVDHIFHQAIRNQDFQHKRMTPEDKYVLLVENTPAVFQHFSLKQMHLTLA